MSLSTSLVRRVRKVAHLNHSARSLLFHTWILVSLVEPALHLFRFKRVGKWLNVPINPTAKSTLMNASEIGAIVETAADHSFTRPKCLARALTAHYLLNRYGLSNDLKIGVSKDGHTDFSAHAWVEVEGAVIVGAHEKMGTFRTILSSDHGK